MNEEEIANNNDECGKNLQTMKIYE